MSPSSFFPPPATESGTGMVPTAVQGGAGNGAAGAANTGSNGLGGHIQFHNVNFTYPTREDVTVLKNIDFECKAGQTVALVGPSGAGKSTIVALMQRFYDPNNGYITLGGHRLTDLDPVWLKGRMALVSQEPVRLRKKETYHLY